MVPKEKERITFYLHKDLIKKLDESATELHMNRSQFIEWLLTEAIPLVEPVATLMKTIFKTSQKQNGAE